MTKENNTYNFLATEKKYTIFWEETSLYKWDENNTTIRDFVIDTPPPTISGHLHMGHVFSYCHTDFIARYKRMIGYNVFYPIGFDDNGLPTEKLVEKKHNIRGSDIDKQEFIKMCNETSEEGQEEISLLFKTLGISFDWSQKYHTASDEVARLSQASFVELYNKGYIYQSLEPTFWDVVDRTAIAQAEIEEKEKSSNMYNIIFNTKDNEKIIIATTRPELLPACVAIFYNPEDERYKQYAHKTAIVPLIKTEVPIIPDADVKIDKGTGLVMCCTFGDELDLKWWKTHKLPLKVIIGKDGYILDDCLLSEIIGLTTNKARDMVVSLLQNNNHIENCTPIIHNVKCAERSGAKLEIILTHQWFVNLINHKDQILEKINQIDWHPQSMKIKILNWLDNLNWNWCISRQRSHGIPIPVWYLKSDNSIIVGRVEKLPLDPSRDLPLGYNAEDVRGEMSVLDTWATSSLTPQINAKGISKDGDRCKRLLPADLRSQAHEIIRTWAFYTIAKSLFHNNDIPWKNIMISGWCRAVDNTKMSKSKGNALSPIKLLENYGSDVLRYWSSTASLGSDAILTENTLKIGKKLTNKLWSVYNLCKQFKIDDKLEIDIYDIDYQLDKHFYDVFQTTIKNTTDYFDKFDYYNARTEIENFFWHHFCDNYLEFIKYRIYNKEVIGHKSAITTLFYIFREILKMFAPFLSFITEEIYNKLYVNGESIHISSWPKYNSNIDEQSITNWSDCVKILQLVREKKSLHKVSIKYEIDKTVISINGGHLVSLTNDLKNVCNILKIEWKMVEYKDIDLELIHNDNK